MPVVTCASWKNYVMVVGNGGALGDGLHPHWDVTNLCRKYWVDVFNWRCIEWWDDSEWRYCCITSRWYSQICLLLWRRGTTPFVYISDAGSCNIWFRRRITCIDALAKTRSSEMGSITWYISNINKSTNILANFYHRWKIPLHNPKSNYLPPQPQLIFSFNRAKRRIHISHGHYSVK